LIVVDQEAGEEFVDGGKVGGGDGGGAEEGADPAPVAVKKWQFWKKSSKGPKKFGWIKGVLVSRVWAEQGSRRRKWVGLGSGRRREIGRRKEQGGGAEGKTMWRLLISLNTEYYSSTCKRILASPEKVVAAALTCL